MQHFAVSAAGRHVSVWHVLHMQMCSQTRAATRAAQTFPLSLSLCSVYYNSVKFLPTCWTARGALGMQLDEVEELEEGSTLSARLYLLCVINYIKSVAALAGHQNELWQHLYKLSLPQECEANLSRCHAPNRVCPASSPSLSLSLVLALPLSIYLSCVLPMTTECGHTQHFSHNILPIKVAATATSRTCHVTAQLQAVNK